MKPLTFQQWRVRMIQETPDTLLVECPECQGAGTIYTCSRDCDCDCDDAECECCAGDTEECYLCDQEGRVEWGNLSPYDQLGILTVERYTFAVADDLNALSAWLFKPFDTMMIEAGFAIYSDINDKALYYRYTGEH